jgi:hypothetical protein
MGVVELVRLCVRLLACVSIFERRRRRSLVTVGIGVTKNASREMRASTTPRMGAAARVRALGASHRHRIHALWQREPTSEPHDDSVGTASLLRACIAWARRGSNVRVRSWGDGRDAPCRVFSRNNRGAAPARVYSRARVSRERMGVRLWPAGRWRAAGRMRETPALYLDADASSLGVPHLLLRDLGGTSTR